MLSDLQGDVLTHVYFYSIDLRRMFIVAALRLEHKAVLRTFLVPLVVENT